MFDWLFNSKTGDVVEKLFSNGSKKLLIKSVVWAGIAIVSISFMSASWEATVVSAFNGQATAKSLLLLAFIPLSLFSVGAAWYYFAKWRNNATENREMDVISQERIKAGLPSLTDDEKRLNKY